MTLTGSNQEIIDRLAAYAALGVKHMTCMVFPWSLKGIERLAPIVEAAHRFYVPDYSPGIDVRRFISWSSARRLERSGAGMSLP